MKNREQIERELKEMWDAIQQIRFDDPGRDKAIDEANETEGKMWQEYYNQSTVDNRKVESATLVASFTIDRWIPIGESLPKIGVQVLVYANYGGSDNEPRFIKIAKIDYITLMENDQQSVTWLDSDYVGIEPTHWMPLPEPPSHE
jgi:hypothetical protein